MNWPQFQCQVPGKWVLTGEHSVLRGGTAIALPHPEYKLSLEFEPGNEGKLSVLPQPEAEKVILDLLHSVRDLWEGEGKAFSFPSGRLEIRSTIPIGAGLGSSAALCVAIARWLAEPLGIPQTELMDFATRLEHRFHGRSSGMDVAVISAGEPVSFVMGRGPRSLGIRKIPRFTFHDTGLRTRTSECVHRLDRLREESPHLALTMDEAMSAASRSAMEGLFQFDMGNQKAGIDLLMRAIKQAQECFYSWQLVPGEARRMEQDLMTQGAAAVKLTGAGGGGMLVALWYD